MNVDDVCSLDDLHDEMQERIQIEIPDSFRLAKNAWDETIILDENGLCCDVHYIRRENDCPVEPYVLLVSYAIMNGKMAGGEYKFKVI